MQVSIFGYIIEVNIKRLDLCSGHPLSWPLRNQMALAQHISEVVLAGGFALSDGTWSPCSNHLIGRIKACRWLLRNEFGNPGTLKASKEFVEVAFANSGRGSDIIL